MGGSEIVHDVRGGGGGGGEGEEDIFPFFSGCGVYLVRVRPKGGYDFGDHALHQRSTLTPYVSHCQHGVILTPVDFVAWPRD